MRENLAAESRALQQERGKQERLATSINDQMHAEAQVNFGLVWFGLGNQLKL